MKLHFGQNGSGWTCKTPTRSLAQQGGFRLRRIETSATCDTHQGERPLSIIWRLNHPMPADLYEETQVAAG
jgi:hypothetical protein